jgi:hypothetical protein
VRHAVTSDGFGGNVGRVSWRFSVYSFQSEQGGGRRDGAACGRLNEAVKRNQARFPEDFRFRLTKDELEALTSQIAIAKTTFRAAKPPVACDLWREGAGIREG